jgi:hypothetical protein
MLLLVWRWLMAEGAVQQQEASQANKDECSRGNQGPGPATPDSCPGWKGAKLGMHPFIDFV